MSGSDPWGGTLGPEVFDPMFSRPTPIPAPAAAPTAPGRAPRFTPGETAPVYPTPASAPDTWGTHLGPEVTEPLVPGPNTDPTKGGMLRSIGAGAAKGGAGVMDTFLDPVTNLIQRPLTRVGMGVYDWLAPHLGLHRTSASDRSFLLGEEAPGVVDTAVNAGFKAAGATPPNDVVPQTLNERRAMQATAGAVGGAGFSPSTALAAGFSAPLGAELGEKAAAASPEWMRPYVEPAVSAATNLAVPVGARAARGAMEGTVRAALTPTDPATRDLLQRAHDEGIPTTVGDATDSQFVKHLASILRVNPVSGYADIDAQTQAAVNRAANRTMGLDTATLAAHGLPDDKVLPAHYRLGRVLNSQVIDQTEAQYPMILDRQLGDELQRIHDQFDRNHVMQHEADAVHNHLQSVTQLLHDSTQGFSHPNVPGEVYGNLVHTGAPVEAAAGGQTSPNMRRANTAILRALTDAYDRSLPPDVAAAYQTARANFSNRKAMAPLGSQGDARASHPSTGDVIPERIRNIVNRHRDAEHLAELEPGDNRLHDLAQITQRLRQPGTSGTAQLSAARRFLEYMPTAATALGGYMMGSGGEIPPILQPNILGPLLAGGGASMMAARGIGSVLRTPPIAQGTLSERAMAGLRASVPSAVAGTLGSGVAPTTNPDTGAPQFNLTDAQNAHSPYVTGLLSAGGNYRDWVKSHRNGIIKEHGGQGFNRAMQVGASLVRGPTLIKRLIETLKAGGSIPQPLKDAGILSAEDLISAALTKTGVANMLAATGPASGSANSWAMRRLSKAIGDAKSDPT